MRRPLLLAAIVLALTGAMVSDAAAVNAPSVGIVPTPSGNGYWLVGADGGVFTHGDAGFFGSMGGKPLGAPVVGMAAAPGGNGYWLVGADGGVFAFGPGAPFHGSMSGQPLNAPVVGIAAAPNGQGYWLAGADGGIFAFGPGAGFHGSLGGQPLGAPVVGIAAAPGGNGYWLAGADGGVFTFGPGAPFHGSMVGKGLKTPVTGIAATPSGNGYWLVGADGGVFALGGAGFFGTTADGPIISKIAGIARRPSGNGYWLADAANGVYSFGDAPVLQPPPARPKPPSAPATPRPPAPPQPHAAPPQSAGGECQAKVTIGKRVLWSTCLRRIAGGYRSEAPVKVAGIDFDPADGAEVRITDKGRVTSSDARVYVTATGPLLPNVLPDGELTLNTGSVDLTLGEPRRLNLPLGKLLKKLGGLPLVQEAGVAIDWSDSGAKLTVAVSLGKDFLTILPPVGIDADDGGRTLKRGFGLEVELSTQNETGIILSRIKGTVQAGKLYDALGLESLSVEYLATDKLWTGGATIVPFSGPLAKHALPTVKGEIAITVDPIGFGKLALLVTGINKPIGPYVFLQDLGGEIRRLPPPWTIRGEAGFSIGPEVTLPVINKTFRAAEAHGLVEWSYPANVTTKADIKIIGQKVASGEIKADLAAARGEASGELTLEIARSGFKGRLEGRLSDKQFLLTGRADVRIFGKGLTGGEAFVSHLGLGACVHTKGFGFVNPPDWGFTLNFEKRDVDVKLIGCDFGKLVPKRKTRQVGPGSQGFDVVRGTRGVLLRAVGAGAQASVVLRGGGREFVLPATEGLIQLPELTALRNDANSDLYVVLNAPAAGSWTIDPLPGSVAVQALETAAALPDPELRGRLRRLSGGRYELRWSTNPVPGQLVGFVERGANGLARTLLRTSAASGRLRFRPTPGPAGVRTIVGAAQLNGSLREIKAVAALRLPAPVRPRRPDSVRLHRSGSRVAVSWPRVRGASGYVIGVRLRDGRRFERFVSDRRRSLVLTGVRRGTRGRVAVRSFTPSAIFSRARTSTLGRR